MALSPTDLDAYLARILYRGDGAISWATLHDLARAHVSTIPFENLDILLDRRIRLEPDAVVAKLVHAERGGYCFEQNALMMWALEALGFAVTPMSARVRMGRPREEVAPRTHLCLRVDLGSDGIGLVDVGVGGMSVTCALRLVEDEVQATPHDTRRLVRADGRWYHQIRIPSALDPEWTDVCEFTGEAMHPIDREVANWYTCSHPESSFKARLIAARAGPDGTRHTLLNREVSVRRADGIATTRTLDDPDELLTVLADIFGLRFPAGTRFRCDALTWR